MSFVWKIAGIAGVAMLAKRILGASYEEVLPMEERRSEPDPEALKAAAAAEAPNRVGLDLDRLKGLEQSAYKPLVEYLTYIQVQRGDGEGQSLVFVRQRDIESLAELTGGSKESFVEDFKQLGVLLSMN
ncbi:MAG: hypothetical protein LC723_00480 [Actinobacteria bacterium]|nr:hypothetical protein [Actinomycetota bacterium]